MALLVAPLTARIGMAASGVDLAGLDDDGIQALRAGLFGHRLPRRRRRTWS